MINTENFSNKFQDIKKVNYHTYQDLRGIFFKIYESKELDTVMPNIDEVYISSSKKCDKRNPFPKITTSDFKISHLYIGKNYGFIYRFKKK